MMGDDVEEIGIRFAGAPQRIFPSGAGGKAYYCTLKGRT